MKVRKWFDSSVSKNQSTLDDVEVLSSFALPLTPEEVLTKEMDKIINEVRKYFPGGLELPIHPRYSKNIPAKRSDLIAKIKYNAPSKRKRDAVVTKTEGKIRKSKRIQASKSKSDKEKIVSTSTTATVINSVQIAEKKKKKSDLYVTLTNTYTRVTKEPNTHTHSNILRIQFKTSSNYV